MSFVDTLKEKLGRNRHGKIGDSAEQGDEMFDQGLGNVAKIIADETGSRYDGDEPEQS